MFSMPLYWNLEAHIEAALVGDEGGVKYANSGVVRTTHLPLDVFIHSFVFKD